MTGQPTPREYRVLLVDLARSYGGAEVRALTQARALQTAVAACTVVTLADSQLHHRLQAEQLPHIPLTVGRASPRLLWTLRRTMRAGGYQIVDAHNVQSIWWAHTAALLAGVPGRVASIHSDYGREYPGLKGRLYEAVLWINRRIARQFINVTEVLQAKAERQGWANRASLIHNAVSVPATPWETPDQTLRAAAWGFAPTDVVVGILARLKPVKGHRYLIDALAQCGDVPQLKLLIVGDGPLLPDLQAQVSALGLEGRVVFAGFRQDVDVVLRAVDIACLASLSEALPYAALEAMALARPLLVTNVGGLATLLDHQRTAYLVPPADAGALADGLRWLVQHPAEARALGLAAYEHVRDHFSVETMIAQVLDVYDRALAPDSRKDR